MDGLTMTLENNSLDGDGAVYGSVSESSAELILQPYAARGKVMGVAWLGLLGFIILVVPFTILPTFLITFFVLATLSTIAPGLQHNWFIAGAILLIWGVSLLTIAILIWKAIGDSGYKTFIFDRTQKQLVINTATIIGRKIVKTIPFSQIQDAQWQELQHDGISISVFLVLEDWSILGLTYPHKIVLSSFASVTSAKTVKTLTARKHHQELLFSVRNALEFSTQQISDELRRSLAIPTAEELDRQQAQAAVDVQESLKQLTKMMFANKETKSENLEVLRSKTRSSPEDPQVWEQFALALSLQKNGSKDEVINAYRQAEALYFDQRDTIKAAIIAETLNKIR
jgi:hypothetical protein